MLHTNKIQKLQCCILFKCEIIAIRLTYSMPDIVLLLGFIMVETQHANISCRFTTNIHWACDLFAVILGTKDGSQKMSTGVEMRLTEKIGRQRVSDRETTDIQGWDILRRVMLMIIDVHYLVISNNTICKLSPKNGMSCYNQPTDCYEIGRLCQKHEQPLELLYQPEFNSSWIL